MISNRKAQGLPINTIILIAVGLLILVLLITFVLGGFKGLGAASPSSSTLSAFSSTCSTYSTVTPASLGFQEWCSQVVANPSGSGTYHCYSDLADAPGTNSTTISLSNGTTMGYSNCVAAGYVS
jgi:FlaG/FlaF family flagellin (archaellin)